MPSIQSISVACLLAAVALAGPRRPVSSTTTPVPSPLSSNILEGRSGRGPNISSDTSVVATESPAAATSPSLPPAPAPHFTPAPGLPTPPARRPALLKAAPEPRPPVDNQDPVCIPKQSVVNPGFEANGGTYSSWNTSDTTVTTITGAVSDIRDTTGYSHALQYTLTSNHLAGTISQVVSICPLTSYNFNVGVYYDSNVILTPSACSLNLQIGGVASNISLGDPTFFAAPPALGHFVEIPIPFTTADSTSLDLSVGVGCTAAFAARAPPPVIYIDNITIKP